DEVPGPNPGSSSRHPRSYGFGALVLYENMTPFGVFFHIRPILNPHLGCRELLLCRGPRFVRKNRTYTPPHTKVQSPHSNTHTYTADKTGSQNSPHCQSPPSAPTPIAAQSFKEKHGYGGEYPGFAP
ncbi:MAG: hypothetical protein IJF05_05870, partial [Clostridia bacterium]|nr:hypothetical protein [Clostridia bacterium]